MRTVRIFIASPADVRAEREAADDIINSINSTLTVVAPHLETGLEVVRWETHAYPAAGRPQAVINEQIGAFDIFIGIMASRFGTPTGHAESGTEEEFRRAYASWAQFGTPRIMFYFSRQAAALPSSLTELEQLKKVLEFKAGLHNKALVWEYSSLAEFKDYLRSHLNSVLGELLSTSTVAGRAATGVPASPILKEKVALLETVSKGDTVRITDIHEGDAKHYRKKDFIGKTALVKSMSREFDGWWTGDVDMEDGHHVFYKVQLESAT